MNSLSRECRAPDGFAPRSVIATIAYDKAEIIKARRDSHLNRPPN